MVWNYLSIPKHQRCSHGRLGIDEYLHSTLYCERDYLSLVNYTHVFRVILFIALQWRHNELDSNHQPHDCLLNRLFRHRSKKTSKLRVTGLCEGNSPVIGEFPTQRTSHAENVSIWWRHHGSENVSIWWRHHGSYVSPNASEATLKDMCK